MERPTEAEIDDMISEFAPGYDERTGSARKLIKEDLRTHEVLFIAFDDEGYEGHAYILLREKATGDLYCVEGSHCSCYGFEGQWGLSKTHRDVLMATLADRNEWTYAPNRKTALTEFLGEP